MINRFHSASPSNVALSIGSQAKKINAGDGFGEMLNALVSPLLQTERQTLESLPEEKNIDVVMRDAGIPIHIWIGNAENLLERTDAENSFASSILTIPVTSTGTSFTEYSSKQVSIQIPENIRSEDFISNFSTQEITDVENTSIKYSPMSSGDVESVVIPWRLQAHSALSYQSTTEPLQNSENASHVVGITLQKTSARVCEKVQLQTMAGNTAPSGNNDLDKNLAFYPISEAGSMLLNVLENTRVSRAYSQASFVMWPQRALHWLSDGDSTTAWVRDYTLDAASTGTLVEALRCFSEQQGFTLRRIMLNGHEIWRAPSTF